MESIELKPVGDRELHVVADAGWSVPIFCDPYSDAEGKVTHYIIRPALGLLVAPHEALAKRLARYDLAKEKTFWVITASDLKLVAEKAQGITPSYYFKWEEEQAVTDRKLLDTEKIETPPVPGEDFLKFVSQRSALDLKLLKLCWSEWQRAAMDWLLNEQKPIELSFGVLRPIPYRVNWKEIILAKHPKCAPIFLYREKERRDFALLETGFLEDMGSAEMAAVDGRAKNFYWTLELTTNDFWRKCVKEAEVTRLGTRGPSPYAAYYEARLKKQLPEILEAFTGWLRQMAIPVGAVGESAVSGQPILLPENKNRCVLPRSSRPSAIYFQVQDRAISLKPRPRTRLEEKAEDLLSLPRVPQRVKDVRECESSGLLEPPRDEGGENDRLPVLVPDESQNL